MTDYEQIKIAIQGHAQGTLLLLPGDTFGDSLIVHADWHTVCWIYKDEAVGVERLPWLNKGGSLNYAGKQAWNEINSPSKEMK